MKYPYPWIFFFLLSLPACGPSENPFDDAEILTHYLGHWKRLNVHENDVTEVVILQKSPTQVSIQLLGECVEDRCAWGTQYLPAGAFAAGPVTLLWLGKELEIRQTLSLTEYGKLQIISEEDYLLDSLDRVRTYLFTQYDTQTLYQKISRQEAVLASLSRTQLPASPGGTNHFTPGTVVLYQTTTGRYGKMQVRGNDAILTLRWHCWNEDGSTFAAGDYLETQRGAYFEMDQGQQVINSPVCIADFLLEEPRPGERVLLPQCGASFVVYHQER